MTSTEAKVTAALLTRYSEWGVRHDEDDKTHLFHTPSGFKVHFFSNGGSFRWSSITVEKGDACFQVPKQDIADLHTNYWLPRVKEAHARQEEKMRQSSANLLKLMQEEFITSEP